MFPEIIRIFFGIKNFLNYHFEFFTKNPSQKIFCKTIYKEKEKLTPKWAPMAEYFRKLLEFFFGIENYMIWLICWIFTKNPIPKNIVKQFIRKKMAPKWWSHQQIFTRKIYTSTNSRSITIADSKGVPSFDILSNYRPLILWGK